MATLALAGSAFAGISNCCIANGGLGCDDDACEAAVCAVDSFCCATAWDGLCAGEALSLCEVCAGISDCCFASGGLGCSDDECEAAVCAVDSFCCAVAWDGLCAGEALSLCAVCAGGPSCNECCPTDLNFDGVTDGADLGLLLACWGPTTDDCACADFNGDGSIDGADLGLLLAAWGPCPSEITCDCQAADHDCCTQGGPGCTDLKCCEAVCAVDSFCCENAWDGICVGEAESICGLDCPGLCPPSDHDCCTQGGPGCTDVACCEAVCAVDSFCCATSWDGLCVGEAVSICGLVCALCPVSDHDCYTTGAPGCTDVECCDAVCAVDSFCCAVAWDGICVNEAFSICGAPKCEFSCPPGSVAEPELCGEDTDGGCNVPIIGDSNCCFANGGIGCDDPTCQDAVCAVDSFCCAVAWDGICAAEALSFCPDVCQLGKPGFAAIACGQTVCGTAWADGSFRDTDWYEIEFTQFPGTEITFSISTTLPMVIGIVDTNGIPDCALATALNPFAVAGFCGTAEFSTCLAPGVYWFFAAPNAFSGFPCGTQNDYAITLACGASCTPPSCGNAGHDCLTTGGPFCDDETCCQIVCASDPFCCDVAWDATCVATASIQCYGQCPPSDHDCFTTGGVGCTDNDCCLAVCGVDLFCCQVAWDGICVNEAFSICGAPKCPFTCEGTPEPELCGEDTDGGCNVAVVGDSNCCFANGGIGCDDPTCQDAVCAVDSFCCAVAWDGICAAEAVSFCPDICQLGKPSFAPISCGETVCGTAWADGSFRDTDWYEVSFSAVTNVNFSASTTLTLVIGIVDTGGIPDCALAAFLNPFATVGFCGTASFDATLNPGTYWFFAAPNTFSGFPCGTTNDYSVTLTCN